MKFLFFDCEVANSFDGLSKICSIGYVLTDKDLNIIKKEDIIINPESVFDKHLFSKKYEVNLYYPKSVFYKYPNFKKRYNEISSLFDTNTIVVGFSINNDIKFLCDACNRYNLKMFDFNYLDVQLIHQNYNNNSHAISLEKTLNDLDIDKGNIICHKSDDDAYMSYLVFKKLFMLSGLSLVEFLDKYKFKTYKEYLLEKKAREKKKALKIEEFNRRKELVLSLNKLYGKCKNKGPLLGKKYTFSKRVSKYADEAIIVQKYIYDNGGITYKDFIDGNIMIIDINEPTIEYDNNHIEYIKYNEIRG